MTTLIQVTPQQKERFWNVHQKYLYEMTNYYDDPMDENGNYHYDYFEEYFTDPNRNAFFIYDDESLVEFLMMHPYAFSDAEVDHVLAEFTIFPHYRKRHFAKATIQQLFCMFPGWWQLKYHENNEAAKKLWNSVTKVYQPQKTMFSEYEAVLRFYVE